MITQLWRGYFFASLSLLTARGGSPIDLAQTVEAFGMCGGSAGRAPAPPAWTDANDPAAVRPNTDMPAAAGTDTAPVASDRASASAAQQQGSGATSIFARLLHRNNAIRDFRAVFEQRLLSRGLNPPPPESGRVYYLRPYRMRWEYTKPEKKLAVSDGDTGWLFLPEEKRVLRMKIAASIGAEPLASLLSGSGDALKRFRAETIPSGKGEIALRLLPATPQQDFDAVEVRVDSATLTIREVHIVDPGGNRMIYRFSEMEENVGLPGTLFTFVPPPGVEVLDQ